MQLIELGSYKLLYVHDKDSLVSELNIVFPRGGKHDTFEKKPGISHMLEHMLFKGDGKTSFKIKDKLSVLGADTNASVGSDYTSVEVFSKTEKFKDVFNLLMDLVLNPSFPEKELELEKKVVLEEIKINESDNAHFLVHVAFPSVFYRKSFYNGSSVGEEDYVKNIQPTDLTELFNTWFFDKNKILFTYTGGLSIDELSKLIDSRFLSRGNVIIPSYPKIGKSPIPKSYEFITEDIYDRFYFIAGKKFNGLDFKTLLKYKYLSAILTGFESSILFRGLREKKGLIYNIDTKVVTLQTDKKDSFFIVETELEKSNSKAFIRSFEKNIGSLNKNVTNTLLKMAKSKVELEIAMLSASKSDLLFSLMNHYITYGNIDMLNMAMDSTKEMSISDMKEVADTLLGDLVYCVVH